MSAKTARLMRSAVSLLLILFAVQTLSQSQSFGATFTTWTQRASALSWTSVACSTNCEIAYGAVNGGKIYKSTDGGATWSSLTNSGTYSWRALATSGNGDIVYGAVSGGYIYKSVDGGQSWTTANGLTNRSWISLTTDSTGATIAGGVSSGSVWLSTDSASTWSEVTTIGTSKIWKGLTITPAGTVLVAGASTGEVWRGVLNSGSWTWTNITSGKTTSPLYGGTAINLSSLTWNSLAIDTTGNRIAAISNDLYFTSDGGATWKNITWGNYSWASVSGSSDLKTMMMLASNGCGSNCRPHIVTTSDYVTFNEVIVGTVGVPYSSGDFAQDASRAIAATSSSFIYTAGDTYVPVATPANSTPPSISGTAAYGQVLASTTGVWSNSPTSYTYQWSRSATSGGSYTNISGATSSTYTLASSDVSQYLKVAVSAINSSGSATSTSNATSQISKATPTFSSWSNVSKVFGDLPYTVSAPTVTDSLSGSFSYASDSASVVSVSGTTLTVSGAGSATITATFTPTDSTNYNTAITTNVVTVAKGSQASLSITSTSGNFGTNLSLTTSGGSGNGSIVYSQSAGTTTCTLNGSMLTAAAPGTCLVTATKASDSNYNSVASSQTTVTFAQGKPTASVSIDAGVLVFRQAKNLTSTSNVSGKMTFRANNMAIARCKSLSVNAENSYTATCAYKPSTRGIVVISVVFTPTSSSYTSTTTFSVPQAVTNRTNKR